jgi:hypothetical protein
MGVELTERKIALIGSDAARISGTSRPTNTARSALSTARA